MTASTVSVDPAVSAAVTAGAASAAALLPSATPLVPGAPVSPLASVGLPAGETQAVHARFTGAARGEVAVIVGGDLVEALRNSPMGELDLTAAVQPALQAVVDAFGTVALDPGQTMDALLALEKVGQAGPSIAVPLLAGEGPDAPIGAVVLIATSGEAEAPRSIPEAVKRSGMDMLRDVEMELTVELGRTRMTVRELLALAPGAVVELDRAAGSPADLLVNGRLIARGEIVVVDEDFAVRITEIIGNQDESPSGQG
jgi:flagellar motor switch protein FliN/FliY